ncbi:MAG TPA: hypothetical protein VM870_01700 [Pyrinomonadaceae bacterium]|jgi:hypothetical protein|nr:hypothetical protein [Pyrinomonadaceae bacterium]
MPYISPLTLFLQLSGAVMMAVILHHFYRVYGLHYLLLWRRSWLALGLHLASSLLLLHLMRRPEDFDPTLRWVVSVVCFSAGFAQVTWLLFGAYKLGTERRAELLKV